MGARGRRRAVGTSLACAALLLLAGPASATSNTTIGFDNLSAGTIVGTQYQSAGLVLGKASDFGQSSPGQGDCGSPTVQSGGAPSPPPSLPNYAQLAACNAAPVGAPAQYYAGTYASLQSYPRGSFSVEVVNLNAAGPSVAMSVTGYNSAGQLVATGSGSATATWSTITASQTSGSPAPATIKYVFITTSNSAGGAPRIAIDDVSFDQAGAPLSASGTPISATAGSPFSGPVATITDNDPTALAGDFTASINWGDGTSTFGTVGGSGGTFTVTGSHTWGTAGSFPVQVAITKVNGRTTAADTTAQVAPGGGGATNPTASGAVITPKPTAGGLVTLSGAGSTPGRGRIISFDWGFGGGGTTTSTGTNPTAHFIFKPGFHVVTLKVTNSGGQQSTSKFGVNVGNTGIVAFLPDGGQGPCQPSYDNGNVHIIAECIQTLSGGGYVVESRQLDLNGMTLEPKAGGEGIYKILPFKELGIGSGTHLSGPPTNVVLLNTPIGDMVLGGLDLTANPINLTFTAYQPPHITLGHGRRAVTADDSDNKTLLMQLGVGKQCTAGVKDPTCCPPNPGPTTACATLPGGFPLTGQVSVYLNNKGQSLFDVQVGLDLSAVNFEATGALEVVADPVNGINLNSLHFAIPSAGLANIFQVKNASFVYYFPSDPDASKRDTWQAKGTIIFGPLSQPSLAGELDFQKGQFHKASMVFTAPSGTGVPIYPGILLNQIGATVGVNPLEFGGQLGASIATQLELSLAFLYSAPTDTQLGFFGGQGQLSLQDDKIATLAADVYSDGYTDAALDIDLHFPFSSDDPVVKVTGHIGFWDEPSSGRWEADGSVALKLWIISAEVAGLVNNQYVAGCADISGFGVQGRYAFADGSIGGGVFGFSNCDDQLKQYKEKPVTPHTGGFVGGGSAADLAVRGLTAAATRGGGTITLPGGTDGEELLIASNGTPSVVIYGPGHRLYASPTTPGHYTTTGGQFFSAIAPDGHHVIVFLRHPQGGVYNIQPTAQSAPLTGVATAQDVPPARITVHVTHRRGRAWALAYRIANYVTGTRVQFVERGRDSTHVLGTASQSSGTIAFVPQDAIGRHRAIVAYLRTAGGNPLRTVTVGSYTAPAAIRPGPLLGLRFVRTGTGATLSWAPSAGARRYFVLVRGSDGRVISTFLAAGRRRLLIGGVLASERFTARVTPQGGPNLLPGRTGTISLAAAGPGKTELLVCAHGRCTGTVVNVTLVTKAGEVLATLTRGRSVRARGIASDLRGPGQLSLAVGRPLARGRYTVTLRYRRTTVTRQLTLH